MLNREPMGMKHILQMLGARLFCVSVLNREPMGMKDLLIWATGLETLFQCSTASRWG